MSLLIQPKLQRVHADQQSIVCYAESGLSPISACIIPAGTASANPSNPPNKNFRGVCHL